MGRLIRQKQELEDFTAKFKDFVLKLYEEWLDSAAGYGLSQPVLRENLHLEEVHTKKFLGWLEHILMKILIYKRHGIDSQLNGNQSADMEEDEVEPPAIFNQELDSGVEGKTSEELEVGRNQSPEEREPVLIESTLYHKTFDSNEDTAIPSIMNPSDLVSLLYLI